MTLRDAIRLMGATARVTGRSGPGLAAEVAARQRDLLSATPGLSQKSSVITAQGLDGDLLIRPIAAMLELARGTSLNDDPDISAVARRWSVLRHLGVFALDPKSGSLRLDHAALQFIGPNQRRVLSEELGIGFGIVAAKAWCQARNPAIGPITAIDVDRALHRGQVPNLQRKGERQPDYLLSYPDPANPSSMVFELLETKGTVSRANARGQLARAVTQLAGLTAGGRSMTGVAISTVSNTAGITLFAVDPEEAPLTWAPSEATLEYWRGRGEREREDVAKLDIDPDELFASATNVDRAAQAEFSGQYEASARWLPTRGRRGSNRPTAVARRETDVGTFVGVEAAMDLGGTGHRLLLFQGAEIHVAEELRGFDDLAVVQAQQRFAGTRLEHFPNATTTVGVGGVESAVAYSSDGSVLELRLG